MGRICCLSSIVGSGPSTLHNFFSEITGPIVTFGLFTQVSDSGPHGHLFQTCRFRFQDRHNSNFGQIVQFLLELLTLECLKSPRPCQGHRAFSSVCNCSKLAGIQDRFKVSDKYNLPSSYLPLSAENYLGDSSFSFKHIFYRLACFQDRHLNAKNAHI